jgi:hypothetical protein
LEYDLSRLAYADVVGNVRTFANASGDAAVVDNLDAHHISADIDDLVAATSKPQQRLLLKLADAIRNR